MEHEDNAHLDNFLQGSQHLMENLQMASGDSMCENVVDEIGGNIGGKFDEHEVHDDEEEWKYIKEGQQNEKQQQQIIAGMDSENMEGIEGIGNGYGYAYEHRDAGAGDMPLLGQNEVDNGVVGIAAAVGADALHSVAGIEENEDAELDIIKTDGDFSTTSNTTSTNGEDGDITTGVLQVEMKIEQSPIELLTTQTGDLLGNVANEEEDEPSSLATNTTNGTNSLSENAPQQNIELIPTEDKVEEFSIEDKENVDPLSANDSYRHDNDEEIRPNDLDVEMHSQLNPNATEFVPSFGSNPASPTAPTNENANFLVGAETKIQPHPTTLPHHLLNDDDFVAQSPRKGNSEYNLDGIAIPEENDFEHEAAKRPHELEQEDDIIAVGTVQHTEQQPQLQFDQCENYKEAEGVKEDNIEYRFQSPSDLIDHGPETSVDLDADIESNQINTDEVTAQPDASGESIEDVLNTVQPLPIDNETLNSSNEKDLLKQGPVTGKELFDVEEKENISNSPSTEEMQVNVQNEINSSERDIPQIPIDMDSAAHMQESFYLESTSSRSQQKIDQFDEHSEKMDTGFDEPNEHTYADLAADPNVPIDENSGTEEVSFEAMRAAESHTAQTFDGLAGAPASLNIFASDYESMPAHMGVDVITPSPISTEEKHLVEETKEQTTKHEYDNELEQKMDCRMLSTKDEILSQVEEVAQAAANIVESMNPFNAPEPEQHETVEQLPIEANHPFTTESQPQADFLLESEQHYHNEQKEQHHETQDNESSPLYAQMHEPDLLSSQPVDQPPASPAKLESDLKGFEDSTIASFSVEGNIPSSISTEPAFESTPLTEQPETLVAESESQHIVIEHEVSSQPDPTKTLEVESTLEMSNDIISNDSTGEIASETAPAIASDATLAPITDEPKPSEDKEILAGALAATAAAAAAVTAVAVAADKAEKKTIDKKPRTPTSTKTKALDAKKTAEPIKKPLSTGAKTSVSTTSTARPRTAPAKTSTTIEKKPATTLTATKSSTTRKPLTSTTTTTAKTLTKTTAARPTTAPAAKTAASRTTTVSTTVRRSAPTTNTAASTATSNGSVANKSKPTNGAPTKPTTLGLSSTAKPKLSSPRTTLTSQLRKTTPAASTGTGISTAKSPLKTTATTTNGVTKSSVSSTAASRAKSSTSNTTTTSTTTTTKTFHARPAPKTTHSTTLSSTTVRRTVGSVTSSTAIGTKTASTNTLLKKTPPGNVKPSATGKSSLSPTKTSSSTLKVKTKEMPKKSLTPIKSANGLKQKSAEAQQAQTNGTANEEVGNQVENKTQLNGSNGDGPQENLENGIHHVELENGGEGSLLEHHVQAPLIDA